MATTRRIKRRLPRPSEIAPLLKFAPRKGDRIDRRLAKAQTIADLRVIAKKHTPNAPFDYVDGAAETETSLARARALFAQIEFRPHVLRDVSQVDLSTTILGQPSTLPLIFAPTGFTRMMHHEGEPAVARVAGKVGIPYALSTVGTTSPERLAKEAPDTNRWFQLYVWRDRDAVEALLARAKASGFNTLVLTVDTQVAGARLRDVRNGLTIPPTLTLRTLAGLARYPSWWFNLLTTEPLAFATFSHYDGTVAELIGELFDPSLSMADVAALRELWDGPLVIKGIQHVDDARQVVDLGVDGIVVSNHGGRQLDRAVTPLTQLPEILEGVAGRCEVFLDGGVMSGADVIAAVAHGADAVMVGRAYMYGLMAGGERGVQRAADILASDMRRTMQLLGARNLQELSKDQVRIIK
ncbi:MAG: alpha-hydroxy acid oxidase [Nitriliruptoraceae bacterium]